MFWIIALLVFAAVCTPLVLRTRAHGRGDGTRDGGDNHNALQNGAARSYARRNGGNGPFN